MKKAEVASSGSMLVAVGMGFYWPFFTHPLYPLEIFAGQGGPTWAFMSLFFLTCLFCALAFVLANRSRGCKGVPRLAPPIAACVCAVLAVLANGNLPIATVACWISPIVLGLFIALLTVRWATCVRLLPAGEAPVTLTLSLALSTVLSIVAYDVGALWGLTEAASTYVLPLASSLVACFAASTDIRAADGLVEGRSTDGSRRTDASRVSRLRWLVMLASLFIYLLGSGLFRSAFTSGAGYEGVTQDWPHRVLLLGLSLLLVVCAFVTKRHGRDGYPWVACLIACVTSLYCGVLFYPTFSVVANEIMLPIRPISIFLMWVAAEQLGRLSRHDAEAVVLCGFLPGETLTRATSIWFGGAFWTSEAGRFALEIALLVTALALTFGIAAWIWLSMRTGKRGGEVEGAESERNVDTDVFATLRTAWGLSDRETEVMRLLARGYTQKRIAEELCVSLNSVQTYAKSLYRKLGVHSRQEVIDLASRTGQDERDI